jgi:hypothetical protein
MRFLSGTAIEGTASARLESVSYPVVQINQAAGSVRVSGATNLVGVLNFEVSQEVGSTFPITLFQPQHWTPVTGGSLILNQDGTFPLPTIGLAAQWMRLVFEPTIPDAGASLSVILNASGSSPSGSATPNFVTININNGGSGGVSTFTATSLETMQIGMLVARDASGNGVIIASGNDAARMPAIGMVTEIASDGLLTIQSHGPVVNKLTATSAKILFVGVNGFPTATIAPLTHVQPIGTWGGPNTLILSVSPQMTLKFAT